MQRPIYITNNSLKEFIDSAIREDIADGDHSSLATIPLDSKQKAKLLVKENCVLAGVELAKYIFSYFHNDLKVDVLIEDGAEAKIGDIAFYVEGSAQKILTAERLVLNCMQRMSGIASLTKRMVSEIKHTNAKLLDTRKTTPNFRICEKWAVLIGGGHNHRFGLYDMVMLKDNHIDFAGGIEKAVGLTKEYLNANNLELKIEVETRNLDEVQQALNANVNRIMLDNFEIPTLKDAVKLINNKCETEASGGITLESIKAVAETGVNYISSGALTHSAKNIDLSLKAV